MNTEYLWLVLLLWTLAAVLAVGGLIWGLSSIYLRLRNRWRKSVWDTAARMLAENRREVENYVAVQTMDAIEYREYELRPTEIPDLERQRELTKEEALNGMVAQAAEAVRLRVENVALRTDLAWYQKELARVDGLRARYWRKLKNIRALKELLEHGQEEDHGFVHQELASSGQRGQDEGEQGAARSQA